MKRPILVKSFSNGITIVCSPEADYEEILSSSAEHFKNTAKFFRNASLSLRLQGRLFTEEEIDQLVDIIEEAASVRIIGVSLADHDPEEEKKDRLKKIEKQIPYLAKMIKGPIRNGQIIREEVSLVIDGDVHAGANVYSAGNILVLGRLEGLAHAGYPEDESSFVAADIFHPAGIWIGRTEGLDLERGSGFQMAKLVDQKIVLQDSEERIQPSLRELTDNQIIWFTSGEREAGTSTCLIQTAYQLAAAEKKVLYLDLDGTRMLPHSTTGYHIENLLDEECSFFQAAVKDKKYPGLTMLAAGEPVDLSLKRQKALHALLADKKREYDHILIDHARPIDRDILYLSSEARKILVISRGEYQSVVQTDQLLGRFSDAGYEKEIPVLINAYTENRRDMDYLTQEEIARHLEVPIALFIPQDPELLKCGCQLLENTPAGEVFSELLALLIGKKEEKSTKKEKNGFFSKAKKGGFLFKR